MDPKTEQRNSQFKIDHLQHMVALYRNALSESEKIIRALQVQNDILMTRIDSLEKLEEHAIKSSTS